LRAKPNRRGAGGNPPDLYECGYRALREELGIEKDGVGRLDMLAFILERLGLWPS
jgi:hypothetical protein